MGVGFENKHIHGLKKCFNSKPPLVYDKIYEITLLLLASTTASWLDKGKVVLNTKYPLPKV